jgi:hypothetical protein
MYSTQGESWTQFQLLPEEYRVAAEANARAALQQAGEQYNDLGTEPAPAPEVTPSDEKVLTSELNENDDLSGSTLDSYRDPYGYGYDVNADGYDAVRVLLP